VLQPPAARIARLSAVKWMSKGGSNNSSYERAFKYYYDAVDRDTAAIYAERPATASSTTPFTTTHGWDENRITYDQNGNIQTLYRNSATQGAGNHTSIDQLTYTYNTTTYPNQLKSVSDASGSSLGFADGSGTYTYDANGNLTNEPYKGLQQIYYNALNRTDKITFTSSANRYITYIYDANGTLIRKMQYDNVGGVATLMNTTDYIDGFVYITAGTGSPALSYIQMPEGRSMYNGSGFTQEYAIGDHQGNTRICFNNTGTGGTAQVVQENSYYAFGLIMPGTTVSTGTTPNKNLYNGGSEWQNDYSNLPDYYQTLNRNYDAALGRFVSVDPEPESAESMSNYQYAGNMPMMFNDPDGAKATNTPPQGVTGLANLMNEDSEFEASVAEFEALSEVAYWSYQGNWDAGGADYSGFWNAFLGQVFGPNDNYDYLSFDNSAMTQLNDYYNGGGDGNGNFILGFNQGHVIEGVAPWSDSAPQGSSQTAGLSGGASLGSSQSDYASNDSGGDSNLGLSGGGAGGDLWDKYGFEVENKARMGDGALFIVDFKDPGNSSGKYNWIQTVSSSGEFDKDNHVILPQPHIDGPRWSSGKLQNSPFIFGTFNPDMPNSGKTSTFGDYAHGETWFAAELTLIVINADGTITAKGTFIWGYNKAFPTMFLGPLFYTTPSPTQRGLIFIYNYLNLLTK